MDILRPIPSDSNPNEKCCTLCGTASPSLPQFFYRDKNKADGLSSWCKVCSKKKDKERSAGAEAHERARKQKQVYYSNPEKRQARREYLNRPDVYSRLLEGQRERARRPEVKAQIKAYQKEYYQRPEIRIRVNAYRRDYHQRPEVNARRRAHAKEYSRRPEIILYKRMYAQDYYRRPGIREHHARTRKLYMSRPEIQERSQQYRKSYRQRPEVRERLRVHDRNRRAREKSLPGTHTPAQIADLLKRQRYHCYYAACGHAKFKKINGEYLYHVEHTFPLSRENGENPVNDISYLVLACPACNIRKQNKYPWEFPEGGRLL